MDLFKFFIKGVSISFLVKFSGLLRDGLTFYNIGVSQLFDSYVYYLTFPALITAFVLPLINLWLVPVLSNGKEVKSEGYINFFMVLALLLAIVNLVISFFVAFFIKGFENSTLPLVLTSTLILIFTICSEALASKIISHGKNLQKMYFSNLFVNAPVVFYLLLPEPTVIGLAVISSFSFVLRFVYLLKYSDVSFIELFDIANLNKVFKEIKKIELSMFKKILLGPLFQCAVYLGRLFCIFLPSGALSIYFYSFKLFEAFKGTLLFVGLTKFFSIIQSQSLDTALRSFKRFSFINFLVSIFYVLSLLIVSFLLSAFLTEQKFASELKKIIELSYVTVPLCFLYPSLVFYQRLVVTFKVLAFNFLCFITIPFFVVTGLSVLFFMDSLSVNYIIGAISFALVIPNLYVFLVVYKYQRVV